MSQFEDFVNLELPKRPPMLTLANSGFDGDPNTGSPPAGIANAPQGTFFFQNTGNVLWIKDSSSPGTWAMVGSGGGGGGGTQSPLTWHVETSGNDTTGDGSVGAPFATPTGALAKLASTYGERIKHLVKILVGIGNFPGFLLKGWEMDPADNTVPCGIQIIGTLIPPTLASGTATGTFTAVAPGQLVTDVVYAVVTDSAQNWVVNALRGYHIEVLTGTSALQMLPIIANTATTITVPVSTTFGSVGGTYAIRDFGSVINTTVPIAPSIPAANSVTPPTALQTCLGIFNAEVAPANVELRVEQLKFNPPSMPAGASTVNIQGEAATVTRCFIGGTGGSSRVQVNGGIGTITVSANTIVPSSSSVTGITSLGTGVQNLTQNLLTASLATPGAINMATGISIGGFASLNLTNSVVEYGLFGIPVSGQNVIGLTGVTVYSQSSQCIRCRVIEGNSGASFFFGTGVKLVGPPASTGLEIQGPAFASITGLFISGALYGITLAQGGKVRLSGTDNSMTSVTNEIILDNFAAPFTLATLRAQTPDKVLTNNFGSYVWEA